MKNFYQFINELYKSTYLSAAEKAHKLNHRDREIRLTKYGKEKGIPANIDRISSFVFDFEYIHIDSYKSNRLLDIISNLFIGTKFYIIDFKVKEIKNTKSVITSQLFYNINVDIVTKNYYDKQLILNLNMCESGKIEIKIKLDNYYHKIQFENRNIASLFKRMLIDEMVPELKIEIPKVVGTGIKIEPYEVSSLERKKLNEEDLIVISDICKNCVKADKYNRRDRYYDRERGMYIDRNGFIEGEDDYEDYLNEWEDDEDDYEDDNEGVDEAMDINGLYKCYKHEYDFVYVGFIKRLNINDIYFEMEKEEKKKPIINYYKTVSHTLNNKSNENF